ncbi:hypothetical protein ACE6ED_26535, partial [Paenibacillus sp. CN-4]|uniref:hypothetical protein n=1 Tax=Paenibacillus nanchangensis TaxID=3348343 RepID=UPI00397B5D93
MESNIVKNAVITKSDSLALSLTVVNHYKANVVFVITAFDKANNIIESSESTVVKPTTKGVVVSKNYSLEASQKIDHFGVLRVVSDSSVIRLLSAYSWRNSKGEISVRGIVGNSNDKSQHVGIVATGYDVNNQAVETKTTATYTSKGSVTTHNLVFEAGSQINRIVVKETGQASEILLLSSGSRLENGKVIATGAVE